MLASSPALLTLYEVDLTWFSNHKQAYILKVNKFSNSRNSRSGLTTSIRPNTETSNKNCVQLMKDGGTNQTRENTYILLGQQF